MDVLVFQQVMMQLNDGKLMLINENAFYVTLTHFWSMFPFYTSTEHLVFLCFQGV